MVSRRRDRRGAGIAVGGDGDRHPLPPQRCDRRRLLLAQDVERAGKQHRDGSGARHGGDAVLVGIFEMIGRERAMLGGEPGAVQVRELVGMQLDRQRGRPRGGKYARGLLRRERDALAERIDRIRQALTRDRRDHGADLVDVALLVAVRFRRQRVRTEEAGDDIDVALLGQPAGGAQHPHLGGEVEAIARLDLDRGDALRQQPVEPRQACATRSSSLAARVALTVERMPPPARAISS